MFRNDLRGAEVDVCSSCEGLWLDPGELARLAGTAADFAQGTPSVETALRCPRCAGPLRERSYVLRSSVKVDCCTGCEGVFLDRGELASVESLARIVETDIPPARRAGYQRRAARAEALSAVYRTDRPAAKEPDGDRSAFIRNVYLLLLLSLIVLGLGSWVGLRESAAADRYFLHALIAEIGVFLLALWLRRVPLLNLILLFGYTFISGFTLSTVLSHYLAAGQGKVILQAIGVTLGVFLVLTVYVHVTRKDLGSWAGPLFGLLLLDLIGGVVLFFVGHESHRVLWSVGGALLFSAYILHDTSKIVLKYDTSEVVAATLDLHLDIVNLFLDVLRVLSYLDRKDSSGLIGEGVDRIID